MARARVRALVAEPSLPITNALKLFLEPSGYEINHVRTAEQAVRQVRDGAADLVLTSVSPLLDGEALCQKLKNLDPRVPVVVSYDASVLTMAERAQKAGADAWLMMPLKKALVTSVAQAVLKARALQARVEELETEVMQAKSALELHSATNTHDLTFFKKFLGMEVKRSKRYHYPLAFLMVALDGLEEHIARAEDPMTMRAAIRGELLATVGGMLREIDLCVPFTDERLLVFLPHTPREGAIVVGGRLVAKLSAMKSFEGGSGSVGVASHEPKGTVQKGVGFGSLLREASLNLRLAQDGGGNRVEASPAETPSKRDRISLA